MKKITSDGDPRTEFKMPVLIGKVGKLPKKAPDIKEKFEENSEEESKIKIKSFIENSTSVNSLPPAVVLKEMSTPIPYKEPKWSGLCPDGSEYALEVLKSGVIVERIELTKKPYYVFGRFVNCDIVMAHPTISRHHTILQYKAFAEEGEPHSGWYLYDLGSTHGTYLNREKIKPNHYTRVKVGHQIKFGTSTRTYILLGPEFDCDGESELTVTEIKQKALEMKLQRQRMIKEVIDQKEREKAEEERKWDETGIDWGMGEDAEEEPDLADNPYASTANEELYLEDPKKTLRGYFEREGEELQYDCEERGVGQFICRVVLPLDDASGRPVTAEVVHRGKKKDAVVACALEACRILDRAGLLRQARHESRRRKARDWSADDFYDSDDDSYLDRTGTIERKRKRRMIRHGAVQGEDAQSTKPLTYEDLLKQASELESKINIEEKSLEALRASEDHSKDRSWEDIDDLEQFMLSLGTQRQSMARKTEISNTKMNIKKLQAELTKTQKLAEIARPAHMPPLIKKDDKRALVKVASNSVIYGKRIRLKHDEEKKQRAERARISEQKEDEREFVEEMDSDEDELKLETEEVKIANQNMAVEVSKRGMEFITETQHKMEVDSKQNENGEFQEDTKETTKIQKLKIEKGTDYYIKESPMKKEQGKEIHTIKRENLEDVNTKEFSTKEDIIESYGEKGRNTEDKNRKESSKTEKRKSEEKVKHGLKESTDKEKRKETDPIIKKNKEDKQHKKESSSKNSKAVENRPIAEGSSTEKGNKKESDSDKKNKHHDKHRRQKSLERSKKEEKKRHRPEESSNKKENKKERSVEKERNVKDKQNSKESSIISLKTEEKRKHHKEKNSTKKEHEKAGDVKVKAKSEQEKKEFSSEKSKEGDKRKHSNKRENDKNVDTQDVKKLEDKHKTKQSSSEKLKTEERRKHIKHKHSTNKESKTQDVEEREKSEGKHKRKECSSEKSNIEIKRQHSVEKGVGTEKRSKIEDEQNTKESSKTEVSEPEDVNKQNTIENPIKEGNEIMSESGENENLNKEETVTRVYGPMRPPANYVTPENYFEQISDRDLPEITDEKVHDLLCLLSNS